MSKFSYDDLPWDVAEQLQILDLELCEGDITQKGYEKKKSQLLAPYQDLIDQFNKPNEEPPLEEEEVDLGPEPSAADVTDFLDFLPSPTHSPVETEGAKLMEQNINKVVAAPSTPQLIDPTFNAQPPPLGPPQPTPSMSFNRLPPQQQQARPFNNTNNNFKPPPSNFNNRPSFDPRMGSPRPPIYGYQGRPVMNGFNRPPPPQHSPMFRPQYPYRPNMPPPPTPTIAPSQQHSRSPSLDSKSYPRSNYDIQETESLPDWGKTITKLIFFLLYLHTHML